MQEASGFRRVVRRTTIPPRTYGRIQPHEWARMPPPIPFADCWLRFSLISYGTEWKQLVLRVPAACRMRFAVLRLRPRCASEDNTDKSQEELPLTLLDATCCIDEDAALYQHQVPLNDETRAVLAELSQANGLTRRSRCCRRRRHRRNRTRNCTHAHCPQQDAPSEGGATWCVLSVGRGGGCTSWQTTPDRLDLCAAAPWVCNTVHPGLVNRYDWFLDVCLDKPPTMAHCQDAMLFAAISATPQQVGKWRLPSTISKSRPFGLTAQSQQTIMEIPLFLSVCQPMPNAMILREEEEEEEDDNDDDDDGDGDDDGDKVPVIPGNPRNPRLALLQERQRMIQATQQTSSLLRVPSDAHRTLCFWPPWQDARAFLYPIYRVLQTRVVESTAATPSRQRTLRVKQLMQEF